MPPNRKGDFGVDSLATLNVSQFVETSKFQPLTVPLQEQQQEQIENVTAVATVATTEQPVLCTEDLANKAILDRVLQEERLRIQFSADHIIESIQQQQQRKEEEKEETVVRRENANDVEGYWDMPAIPTTKTTVVRARNNKNANQYWEWPSTPQQQKDATIRHILEAEKQRQLFSVEHLEQNLFKEAAALKEKGEQQQQQVPANDSYWQWEANNPAGGSISSNDAMTANEKAALIESILVAEQTRQLLSVEHLEQNLTSPAAATAKSQSAVVIGKVDDDYWAGF